MADEEKVGRKKVEAAKAKRVKREAEMEPFTYNDYDQDTDNHKLVRRQMERKEK